ncbi:hypothetical protein J6590_106721 [Homalodisca vitripennis]|nr:hypothetical protein J6590_106721 [Homalodisca vitripennis]
MEESCGLTQREEAIQRLSCRIYRQQISAPPKAYKSNYPMVHCGHHGFQYPWLTVTATIASIRGSRWPPRLLYPWFTMDATVPSIFGSRCHHGCLYPWFKMTATVILHSPAEAPTLSHPSIYVRTDCLTTISIVPEIKTTKEELRRWDPTLRGCFFEDERPLQYFQYYTEKNCDLECGSNASLSRCGCVPFYYPPYRLSLTYPKQFIICNNKNALSDLAICNIQVVLIRVPSHTGIPINELAEKAARDVNWLIITLYSTPSSFRLDSHYK